MPSPEQNRAALRALIDERGYTLAQVASLLTSRTGRPCSQRAIESWLASPERKSARPCKDWVVECLKQAP